MLLDIDTKFQLFPRRLKLLLETLIGPIPLPRTYQPSLKHLHVPVRMIHHETNEVVIVEVLNKWTTKPSQELLDPIHDELPNLCLAIWHVLEMRTHDHHVSASTSSHEVVYVLWTPFFGSCMVSQLPECLVLDPSGFLSGHVPEVCIDVLDRGLGSGLVNERVDVCEEAAVLGNRKIDAHASSQSHGADVGLVGACGIDVVGVAVGLDDEEPGKLFLPAAHVDEMDGVDVEVGMLETGSCCGMSWVFEAVTDNGEWFKKCLGGSGVSQDL